jgi:hypothetical protein
MRLGQDVQKLGAAMIRFLFRAIGVLLLACSFAALVVDGTRSIASAQPVFTSLQQSIVWLGPTAFAAVQRGLSGHLSTLIDHNLFDAVSLLPTFLVLGLLGILFMLAGRPPAPAIGMVRR